MKLFFTLILVFNCVIINAQHRNDIWCFGDSAGIDFSNLSQPVPIHSTVKSRGSCASIADTFGNLQFYYSYDPSGMSNGFPHNNGNVYNKNHIMMLNGDKIVSALWYKEGIIVDDPSDTNKYYLFTVGVTGNYGLFYSKIDMALNNGNGDVTQKKRATSQLPCRRWISGYQTWEWQGLVDYFS